MTNNVRSSRSVLHPMTDSGCAGAPWLQDFIDELANFPSAEDDDDVDCLTQALNYLRGSDAGGVFDYYRMLAAGTLATGKSDKPAEPSTIRLRVPPGIGGLAIGGTMLTPDQAGTISVSPAQATALLAAGYTRVDR
jgi:hypothetical protein